MKRFLSFFLLAAGIFITGAKAHAAPPSLKVTTAALADAYVGASYTQTLTASGGKTPYTWSITAGALPEGLTLSGSGIISGTPTTVGSNTFTVQVRDANNATATKALAIAVNAELSVATTTLPDGASGSAYSETLAATGGKTPYAWSVAAGALPAGLVLSSNGVISGTPTTVGSAGFTVEVTDANNVAATKELSITVNVGPLAVATTGLSDGYLGAAYSQTLVATGGTPPYSWIASSGDLPAGLGLDNAGVIGGTPTSVGTSSFAVRVTDAVNATANRTLSIAVNGALTVITSTLANGDVGAPYNQTLAAEGGKSPYTWSLVTGALPAGLTLSAGGVISGAPTTAGSSSFTVQVRDANNATAIRALSITVATAPLTITTESLADGYAWEGSYSQTLTAIGGRSYMWTIKSGTLPAGLTLASSGLISGQPTTAGSSSFTVQVKDSRNTATKAFTITVYNTPYISFVPPDAYERSLYSATLPVSGGKPPYFWSIASGALPAGLFLDAPTGVISGTPTVAGSYNVTVQVNDANNIIGTRSVTIDVKPGVSISTLTLPDTCVGYAYLRTLAATGGLAPYNWSITAGSLPDGLTLNAETGAIAGKPTTIGTSNFTVQVRDATSGTAVRTFAVNVTELASISGIVVEQGTGAPVSGVTVTVALADNNISDPADKVYTCNNVRFSGTAYDAAAENDSVRFDCNTNYPFQTLRFQVRNPYGAESYSLSWNGISVVGDDFLAQSFKPTVDGTLTKVSFYLPNGFIDTSAYGMYVQLKSQIDGDRAIPLAKSTATDIYSPVAAGSWIDFTFPTPAQVTAGQQYYLEIRGGVFANLTIAQMHWGAGAVYDNGAGYRRELGVWTPAGSSLVFRTYVDNAVDVDITPPANVKTLFMTGHAYQVLNMRLYNFAEGRWELGWEVDDLPDDLEYTNNSAETGGVLYNGDDLTFRQTVTGAPNQYNDANGWTLVEVNNMSDYWLYPPGSNLLTDQFRLSFNRTVTTVTDANGAFSLTGLPAWGYAATFKKAGYGPAAATGVLQLGEALNLGTISLPFIGTGDISGTITDSSSGLPVSAAVISILDNSGLQFSATTDAAGRYAIPGVTGAFTGTIVAGGYSVYNISGTAIPGQPAIFDAALDPNMIIVTGTVTKSGTGLPAASAWIYLLFRDQYNEIYTAYTDNNGVFKILIDYDSGSVSGSVSLADFDGGYFSGPVARGLTSVFNVQLTPLWGWVSGTISDSSTGQPVPAATVSITDALGGVQTVSADSLGRYQTGVVAPGAYTGQVSKAGYVTQAISGTAVAQNITTLNVSLVPSVRDAGGTDNVAVIEVAGNYDTTLPGGAINGVPRQDVARVYFATRPDVDFLITLSTFNYTMSEVGAQGFYLEVKNDTQGINRSIFNYSSLFGSAGRLQGIIEAGNVTSLAAAPYGPMLDEALTVLNHELMHRFGSYVRYKKPDGSLSTALLGQDSAHWSYLLDTKGSLMYGSGWRDNGDGTFTATARQSVFSLLDLYLMGMIPKAQVPPMLLIDNTAIDSTQLPVLGSTVAGIATSVTIDDIVLAEGDRIPDAAASQKQFTVGFVLLARPGDNTAQAVQAVETVRKAFAGRFAELTQGNGSISGVAPEMVLVVDAPADGATIAGPYVTVTGAAINTTGAETAVLVNGIPATRSGCRFTASHVPLDNGANTLTVTATDNIALTSTATINVTTSVGDYLRIVTNMESGLAPLTVSLNLEGSFAIVNPTITVSGPVAVSIVALDNTGRSSAEFPVEGTYTVTASAVASDSQTYSDTVTIEVKSRQAMESLLRRKWDGMKQGIIGGDVDTAMTYFVPAVQDRFRTLANDVSVELPARLNEIAAIKLFVLEGGVAQMGAIRMEAEGQFAYPILFSLDENGIWKILGF